MKIIITVNTYYPLTDGVQAVTQYEAEGLVKLGHDVIVVTPKYNGLKSEEEHHGVKIIRYNISTKHALYVGDIKGYQKLICSLCNDADVLLNICSQTATTEVLFPVFNKIKCKKVLYMHGFHDFKWHKFDFNSISSFAHKAWNNLRWRYDYIRNKKYFKQYDTVIQLHEKDDSTLFFKQHYNISSEVINNAADDAFFENEATSKKIIKTPYALCVANYIERKNQEFLLKAFYLANVNNFSLVLIGSSKTSYFYRLKKLKGKLDKQYGEHNVLILSDIPREKISNYVKNADIFLLGSQWEAFPISIIEAMASSVPYITTNVGIVRYLPGGIVVNSVKDMAFWISLLVNNKNVAYKLGEAGGAFAKIHFSERKNVRKLDQILKERNYM